MVRGVITAEEDQVRPESVYFRDQAAQIGVGIPETPVDITQVNNAQMVRVRGKILGAEEYFVRGQDPGFDQGIDDQENDQQNGQDNPETTPFAPLQMAGTADRNGRGGGNGPRRGRRVLSAVFIHRACLLLQWSVVSDQWSVVSSDQNHNTSLYNKQVHRSRSERRTA